MLLTIGVYLYKVLICRLLIICCGESILWRFTLVVYCMNFFKQEMITITESFVKNLFILVGFSIFILYVFLTDLGWKNVLTLIDFIDWLIVISANFKQYFSYIKPEYPERTIDHGQSTGKLYHLRLQVECTFYVIYKALRETTPYWW